MKYYIDTHCHLNIEPYINDLSNYVNEIEQDMKFLNIVGTTLKDSTKAIEIANLRENFFAIVGIHPNEVTNHTERDVELIEKLYLENKDKIIAIGETGLDFYYGINDYNEQLFFLNKQFDLAIKYDLTLILHVREAHKETQEFLKAKKNLPRIVIHCFTGNLNDAQEYIKLGCYISFSGIITFKNANELREIIKHVPLELLLTETDSPFLTPVPFRGKTNLPNYVKYVNETIAKIRNMDIQKLNECLYKNYCKCFKIKV